MNRPHHIVFALAVLATGLLLLIPFGVAQSQELTEQQRQERCQNNKERLAELEEQAGQLDKELSAIWSDERIAKARTGLQAIRRLRANKDAMLRFKMEGSAISSILDDNSLAVQWNTCLEKNDPGRNATWNDTSDMETCLTVLESTLGRMIDQAVRTQSRRTEFERQKADLERQMHNHRVNLAALRCDETASETDLSGTWVITQGNYTGVLNLSQSGATLSGSLDWSNHKDAVIERGSFVNGRVEFVLSYPGGLRGTYRATVDASGKVMKGTSVSSAGGSAGWSGTKN